MGTRKHHDWESRPYQVDPAEHIGLVRMVALKFPNRPGLDLEERIAIGTLGMLKAAKIFEPERGFKFSTMATHWIFQAIHREYEMFGMVGRHTSSRIGRVQFRDESKVPEPAAPDESEALDAQVDIHQLFARHGATLKPSHRSVLAMRALGMNYAAIARRRGVTRERIRQIEARALTILRRSIQRRGATV